MATLLRTAAAKSARIFVNKSLLRQKILQPCCYISTSKKNKDSLTTTSESPTAMEETEEYKKLKEHFADWDPEKPKNWVSYGFSYTDRDSDTWMKNVVYFFVVTCTFIYGMTLLSYTPDTRLKLWAQREAFLELERREREGLPLIDPNLIDPAKMKLPSKEEIGDQEIII